MAWGSKTQIVTAQSVSTAEVFSSAVALNPGETAHLEVEANFPASPTDNLVVAVYGTLDAATESWDETPVMEFEVDNGTDPNKASFLVSGLYKLRVGVRRSGSTDTITVDAWHRLDGVSL